MFAALLLSASMVNAGFGEVGGWLNYALAPNSSQTLTWGLINDGDATLHYTLIAPNIRPNNNFSANQTPDITFIPASGNLQPGVTYLDVQVSSQGLRVNDSWTVGVEAVTTPLGNSSGGASIQLATVKMMRITIIAPPKTIKNPLMIIIGLAFIPLLGVAASLTLSFGLSRRRRIGKQPGSVDQRRKHNATKRAGKTTKKNKSSSRRRR